MATRAKIPASFENIHAILGAAMRASAPSDWPARPHLGGPIPQLTGRQQVDLALFCADEIVEWVPPADLADFTAAIQVVRDDQLGKPGRRDVADVAAELLRRRPRLAWLEVARNAAAAARSLNHGGASASDVNKFTRQAVTTTIELLGGTPTRPHPDVRTLVAELDDRMCRAELAELSGVALPAELLFRPFGTGKRPALFLGRSDDRYWLYLKLKSWRLITGSLDEVVGCVPEVYFAEAMARLESGGQKPA